MIIEDPSVFLADFGVPVIAGAVQGVGILDTPGQLTADGMAITTEYTLTTSTETFGWLMYGDEVTISDIVYQVRETRLLDDGAFSSVTLQRLDSGVPAVGRDPRSAMVLDDLGDVTITDPQVGDKLIREATEWVNYAEPEALIDAGTAGVIYVGTAPHGTAEGSAAWSIVRSVFSAAGIRTSRGTVSNVTWTGRTTHSYS